MESTRAESWGLRPRGSLEERSKRGVFFRIMTFSRDWVSVNCTLSNAEHFLSKNEYLFPVLCDDVLRIIKCVHIGEVDTATSQDQFFVGGRIQLIVNNI